MTLQDSLSTQIQTLSSKKVLLENAKTKQAIGFLETLDIICLKDCEHLNTCGEKFKQSTMLNCLC